MIILLSARMLITSPSSAQEEQPTPIPSATELSPSPTAPGTGVTPGQITAIKDLLAAMQNNYQNVNDYTFQSYIKLPNGTSVIDYRCVRPSKVRTEILDGVGKGTTVLYDPDVKKDDVKAKKGAFRVWRSIERLKLQGTPAVESLLDMIVDMMKDPNNNVNFEGMATLSATLGAQIDISLKTGGGPSDTVSPSPTASPSPSEAPNELSSPSPSASPTASPSPSASPGASPSPSASPGAGSQVKTLVKQCYLVEIRGPEYTDTVALDAETLWVTYAKRMKGNDLVFEAVVEDMKINTSPKMDL